MKNQRLLIILICFVGFSLQISAFGQDKWSKVKTNNFTLIGNAKQTQIKRVGIKLEQFREALKRLVPDLASNSNVSTNVIVFKDKESFHPYKPINSKGEIVDWVVGYFQAGIDTNYIALSLGRKNEDAYQTIFHEYVHFLVDNNIGRSNIPPWFGEGLAEFYDQFDVRKDRIVKFGGRNEAHLQTLANKGLIPLDKFFNYDYLKLRIQKHSGANLFYAQSWALMHFLMKDGNGKRRPQLDKFLKLVLSGKKPNEAFQTSFQMTYAEMELELAEYIKRENFNFSVTKFSKRLTSEMNVQTLALTQAEVQASLGDLFYQRDYLEKAEIHLKKALRFNSSLAFTNSTLGLVRLRQKKFNEARKYLERAIKANENDFLIFYRYAYFLSREPLTLDKFISTYSNERTLKMRNALQKSISLNPYFPESYKLLGFINLARNESLDDGISHLKKAIKLTPGRQPYLITLGKLYLRKKDFENAKSIAEAVLKKAIEADYREDAKAILDEIIYLKKQKALREKYEKLAKNEKETNKNFLNKDSKETTEEELEKNRKQTESEAITEVLRKPRVGEERIVGKVSEIKCVRNKIIFIVKTDNQIKHLESNSFKHLFLKTFTTEMRGVNVGCSTLKREVKAVLTYKPFEKITQNIVGNVVAIEFVPINFKLAVN